MRRIIFRLNWTPEPAHVHRPAHAHAGAAWCLLGMAMLTLAGWGTCMALGVPMGGKADLLLGAFAGLMLASVLFGFRYVAYLEPWREARDRVLGARAMRWARRHPTGL